MNKNIRKAIMILQALGYFQQVHDKRWVKTCYRGKGDNFPIEKRIEFCESLSNPVELECIDLTLNRFSWFELEKEELDAINLMIKGLKKGNR